MKIVGFDEFCTLPNGTIYAEWEPTCTTTDMCRRGEILLGGDGKPIDFIYCEVTMFAPNGNGPCVSNVAGRWGVFDYSAKFVIWEKEDIERVIRILTGADTDADGLWPDAPLEGAH